MELSRVGGRVNTRFFLVALPLAGDGSSPGGGVKGSSATQATGPRTMVPLEVDEASLLALCKPNPALVTLLR